MAIYKAITRAEYDAMDVSKQAGWSIAQIRAIEDYIFNGNNHPTELELVYGGYTHNPQKVSIKYVSKNIYQITSGEYAGLKLHCMVTVNYKDLTFDQLFWFVRENTKRGIFNKSQLVGSVNY